MTLPSWYVDLFVRMLSRLQAEEALRWLDIEATASFYGFHRDPKNPPRDRIDAWNRQATGQSPLSKPKPSTKLTREHLIGQARSMGISVKTVKPPGGKETQE